MTPIPRCQEARKTHLLVLQHGLWGTNQDWDRVISALNKKLDATVLVHATAINKRVRSKDGVDLCGKRLAQEIRMIASTREDLRELSLVGLSLGGLICRYTAAELLDADTGLMAGSLKPAHYISIASPHLGCSQFPGLINSAGFYSWEDMHHEMSAFARWGLLMHKALLTVAPRMPSWVLHPAAGPSCQQLFLKASGRPTPKPFPPLPQNTYVLTPSPTESPTHQRAGLFPISPSPILPAPSLILLLPSPLSRAGMEAFGRRPAALSSSP
uniref:DUF676 domain-containing protein n=1 Tax=Tetraselmis sp. GSL018 TaxID=582737 RepID=A0A061S8T0_9CHLO|mmetsp:Transcript_15290/g.36388  ORF Transcript_15290/g.36388 Transcript_15290/m.36388 type:complete len:270 (-) Transcript_15290:113-922(-)